MSSLKDLLPAPTDGHAVPEGSPDERPVSSSVVVPAAKLPNAGVTKVIALQPGVADDAPDYSAIIRQGENALRTVHTRYDGMVEKPREEALTRVPNDSDVAETTRRTKAALESAVTSKLVVPSSSRQKQKPTFVRYTPANTELPNPAGTSRQRIIKMMEAPRDPMEPPRFTQRKAPVNPPSPPVPVMHSPERKLSKEEAAEWKIPPVVSDWKNNRGYTISLDKRLAADGRAHVDRSINDRFAKMAEALYQAENTARADVERRADLQRQVSIRAKAARERELRELADKARRERKGYLALSVTDAESVAPGRSEMSRAPGIPDFANGVERRVEDDAPPSLEPELGPARPGDDFRSDFDTDRSVAPSLKRSRITRSFDRDVSERAALGQNVTAPTSGEVLYDERLFNQDGGPLRGERRFKTTRFRADDAETFY